MATPRNTTKIAVVTGSAKGIGYATVKLLCKKFKGIVFLTSRNVTQGKAAFISLHNEGLHPEYHELNIENVFSIMDFINYIKENYGGIDILVNNAAIAFKEKMVAFNQTYFGICNMLNEIIYTKKLIRVIFVKLLIGLVLFTFSNNATEPFFEQAQVTMRVNYFALVSFCAMMFPLLRPGARVVHLSSSAGHLSRIPNQDIRAKFSDRTLDIPRLSDLVDKFIEAAEHGDHEELGWPNSAYAVSKVAVSALARIHQKQMNLDPREDIVVNAVHPGICDTDMTSHTGKLSPDKGAEAPVYCALLPPRTRVRGTLVWHDCKTVSWQSRNAPKA